MDYVGAGVSFRQASVARLAGVTELSVGRWLRIVCAVNLDRISRVLKRVWAFSIACDAATHQGLSYFDVRLRITINGFLYNLHLMAIPIHDRHTAEVLFGLIVKLFDALRSQWRIKLISNSTDGAAVMTGRIRGISTRIRTEVAPGYYQIWCPLHQIDLVMQKCFEALLNGAFVTMMTGFVAYLRRQQTLIAEMNVTCPFLIRTRWTCMDTTCQFIFNHRIRLREYVSQPDRVAVASRFAPNDSWWIVVCVLRAMTSRVAVVVKRMQGRVLLVSQQRDEIQQLVIVLKELMNVRGPMSDDEKTVAEADPNTCVMNRWALRSDDVLDFLKDAGTFVTDLFDTLQVSGKMLVIRSVAECILTMVQGINNVVAERDANNNIADELPPVMPHELVKLRGRDMAAIIVVQRERLQETFTAQRIDTIETDHQMLREAYNSDDNLRSAIDACDATTSFSDGWAIVGPRFPMLREFSGGLATVFPNTASVESDFSLLKWEKDEYRQSLTDLSLEGILHSKQWALIEGLDQ